MIKKNITPTVETAGSYSVNQQQSQPMRTLPHDYESALEAVLIEVRKNKALQAELDETKALLEEERKYFERLSDVVDEFVRDNAHGTSGAESEECEDDYMTAREWCYKYQLPVSVKELKWIVSDRLTDICITFPEKEQWHLDSVGTRWFPKWACDILDRMYETDDTFLSDYRTE